MPSVSSAELPLLDREGRARGSIVVSCLPRQAAEATLLDSRGSDDAGPLEPVQLLEAVDYLFHIQLSDPQPTSLSTDKPDIFDADTVSGRTGRLRTRLHTGLLQVTVSADGEEVGTASFEVRSRKLDYLRHYRWMIGDIAELLTDLVMERFAPSAQRFTPDPGQDAKILYQRFAFLQALLESERFEFAMGHILSRPHRAWHHEHISRRPSQGLPARRDIAIQIAGGSQRVQWPGGPPRLKSLPATVRVRRLEETVDTAENRFVKFALTEWRNLALSVAELLQDTDVRSAPIARGITEAAALATRLEILLADELFREVGDVSFVPFGSQVLQKREGYRDIFQFYLQAELAASLAWEGGEDVYGAGQRNVAALYEYWTFLQVAKLVATICGSRVDCRELVASTADGLGVGLRRGNTTTVRGRVLRFGRDLELHLRFNQLFAPVEGKSWTVPLRPDISLSIASAADEGEPVWIHFDAKYRIEQLNEIFAGDFAATTEDVEIVSAAKRSDIVKMHAYRDAIRRSAGAYVLYPGTETEQRQEYHEILPGVGAFPLRPSDSGCADGLQPLATFLEDVITHVASQYTQHERGRYWAAEIFRADRPHGETGDAIAFLRRPPADSTVLIASVASDEELNEIRNCQRYGVLVGSSLPTDLVVAQFVLFFGESLDTCEVRAVVADPEIDTDGADVRVFLVLGPSLPLPHAERTSETARALFSRGRLLVSWQEIGVSSVG